jgi:hypothetical protein
MTDAWKQRFDERAEENDAYAARLEREQLERAAEKAGDLPAACRACGRRAGYHGDACTWCGAVVKP